MTFDDFEIGRPFFTPAGKWLCTDKGTRTIVAIRLDPVVISVRARDGGFLRKEEMTEGRARAEGWFNGPPYALAESVFDEYGIGDCTLTPPSPEAGNNSADA